MIPKTTKLNLKTIVENLGEIPSSGFGTKSKGLSPDQARRLEEMASMFESFGECLQNEEALVSSARGISELAELAELHALNDCDTFQKKLVEKDMKDLKHRVQEYAKIAQEAYARMQQLGVGYQDIGHILGRYYKLKPNMGSVQQYPEPTSGTQPLQNEDVKNVCAWCQKETGTIPGSKTGESHGICPDCKKKYFGDVESPTSTEKSSKLSNSPEVK